MASLTAIDPDRGSVIDNYAESREIFLASSDRVESRVEADLSGCRGELKFAARVIERGLGGSVVLRLELEDDGVTWLSGHELRTERKSFITAYDDGICVAADRCGRRVGRIRIGFIGGGPG